MIYNNRIQRNPARRRTSNNKSYASQRLNPLLTLAESRRKTNKLPNKNNSSNQPTQTKYTKKITHNKTRPVSGTRRISQARPIRIVNRHATALRRKTTNRRLNTPRHKGIIEKTTKDEVLRIIPLVAVRKLDVI